MMDIHGMFPASRLGVRFLGDPPGVVYDAFQMSSFSRYPHRQPAKTLELLRWEPSIMPAHATKIDDSWYGRRGPDSRYDPDVTASREELGERDLRR